MHIPAINTDIVIIAIVAATMLYGLVGGAQRQRSLILGTYVGIVLAQTITAATIPALKAVPALDLALGLLVLPILVFTLAPHHGGNHGSSILSLITGTVAGALIVAAGLHIMPPSSASRITTDSFTAMALSGSYVWLVIAAPLVALVASVARPREGGRHRKG